MTSHIFNGRSGNIIGYTECFYEKVFRVSQHTIKNGYGKLASTKAKLELPEEEISIL